METEIIHFNTNWNNKLNCLSFSTIRVKNSNKYKLHQIYDVFLTEKGERKSIGKRKCVYIKNLYIHEITEAMARIDTGYGAETTKNIIKKIYKNVDWISTQLTFLILTSKY